MADNLLPDVPLLIAPHEIDESHLNGLPATDTRPSGKTMAVRYTQLEGANIPLRTRYSCSIPWDSCPAPMPNRRHRTWAEDSAMAFYNILEAAV